VNYPVKPIDTALEGRYGLDLRLTIAIDLLRSHPLVNAIPDGEDSTGRQKMRLQTTEETAHRAMEIAETVVALAEARGWIYEASVESAKALLIEVKGVQGAAEDEVWRLRRKTAKDAE
jgi:hypothetical protein